MQAQYLPYHYYPQSFTLQNDFRSGYGNEYGPEYWNDERFFPFFPLLAPVAFVAGLAVGPLLFNNRPPAYPPYPPPYPPYPPAYAYPPYPAYQGFQGYPQQFGAQAGVSENINIYTQ
ncbi:hypothetical protein [Peribacillus sp. SI8-4]|uniref:hypothetical protein n=1 Tax=Peribacillus sp. SI8-4 TaxID=3048009 RepID=UPI00255357AD|nr:hypothetical protein [Peribacillus sp. SI8-4]